MGVKIKYRTKLDNTKDILKNIPKLNGKKVEVGCFNGEHAWLAGLHEYGCTITPKRGQYLTVPVSPKAAGKKAGDFSDLFVVQANSGEKFLARDRKNGDIELLFWLAKSVKIPERSFLRAGHDEYINEVIKKAEKLLSLVIDGKMSDQQYIDTVGQMLSSKIKKYARDLTSPANTSAAVETKGSSNPLKDTGSMINGISWRTK